MTFTEKSHAFIAAQYYRMLKEQYGERGIEAFIHASRYYGEQRGRRMAQRCIRDGKPLTAANYYRYGEWMPTEEMKRTEQSNRSTVLSYDPDYVIRITRCPWAICFHELGLNETGGEIYCNIIDESLVRGFNPSLQFRTEQTLQTKEFCIQRMSNCGFCEKDQLTKKAEYIRGFGYHCAHIWHAYRQVCTAIFGCEGAKIAESVLNLYAETYGEEDAQYIRRYEGVDFNRCDNEEY